jgi:hypothetical protein
LNGQSLACPLCGDATAVQKVSSLVRSGQWDSGSTSLGTQVSTSSDPSANEWIHTSSSSITSSFGRTRLASLLSQPVAPQTEVNEMSMMTPGLFVFHIVVTGIYFIVALIICANIGASVGSMTIGLLGVVAFVCSIIVAIVLYLALIYWLRSPLRAKAEKVREEARMLEPRYRRASEKWDRSLYCFRHDIAFVPGTNSTTKVDGFQSWLWI